MTARNHADDRVGKNEEEHGAEEREVLPPRFTANALYDVIANVLNYELDAVHEGALRHEALRLLLLEDKEDNEQQR